MPGKAADCTFEQNAGTGLFATEHSQIEIRACRFVEQAAVGLDCWESDCLLEDCQFSKCGEGVAFQDQGRQRMQKCQVTDCSGVGANVREGASPVISGCDFDRLKNGIEVKGTPLLEKNHVQHCEVGILFLGGGGRVESNTCELNTTHGIEMGGKASPELRENVCRDNQQAGLSYYEQAGGSAVDNTLEGNRWGVVIEAPARPAISGSRFARNRDQDEAHR